ncbi:glycosyltransferase [Candidatus Gottesmanbacteria bacterium]|nr:glycosyltransferase [Candidatus Gottesmanbacteria bacterium]
MNSNKPPTISVVIPAYNEEKYLPKTLESVAKLDRKADEVVVIDGGSTDATAKVARSLGAIVITTQHQGIGYARQKGVEAGRSDIMAFTDADTIVPGNWLTKIEAILVRSGVVGVFGGFRVPDGPWFYRFYINVIQPPFNQILYWMGLPMASGQNLAFWKEKAMSVGGFPTDYKIAEDIEMARRLQTVGKVVYLPNLVVSASGRRGNEGWKLLPRVTKAFLLYFFFRKANTVGFPDQR